MKHLLAITLIPVTMFIGFAACKKSSQATDQVNTNDTLTNYKMKITIGSRVFTASLADNSAAKAFSKMLPLELYMTELNGNEKYVDLSASLSASASNPGEIHSGDLMLYASRTLVLFYKDFSTTYSYTTLGKVDDPAGLTAALGSGDLAISFSLDK